MFGDSIYARNLFGNSYGITMLSSDVNSNNEINDGETIDVNVSVDFKTKFNELFSRYDLKFEKMKSGVMGYYRNNQVALFEQTSNLFMLEKIYGKLDEICGLLTKTKSEKIWQKFLEFMTVFGGVNAGADIIFKFKNSKNRKKPDSYVNTQYSNGYSKTNNSINGLFGTVIIALKKFGGAIWRKLVNIGGVILGAEATAGLAITGAIYAVSYLIAGLIKRVTGKEVSGMGLMSGIGLSTFTLLPRLITGNIARYILDKEPIVPKEIISQNYNFGKSVEDFIFGLFEKKEVVRFENKESIVETFAIGTTAVAEFAKGMAKMNRVDGRSNILQSSSSEISGIENSEYLDTKTYIENTHTNSVSNNENMQVIREVLERESVKPNVVVNAEIPINVKTFSSRDKDEMVSFIVKRMEQNIASGTNLLLSRM